MNLAPIYRNSYHRPFHTKINEKYALVDYAETMI